MEKYSIHGDWKSSHEKKQDDMYYSRCKVLVLHLSPYLQMTHTHRTVVVSVLGCPSQGGKSVQREVGRNGQDK